MLMRLYCISSIYPNMEILHKEDNEPQQWAIHSCWEKLFTQKLIIRDAKPFPIQCHLIECQLEILDGYGWEFVQNCKLQFFSIVKRQTIYLQRRKDYQNLNQFFRDEKRKKE